MIDILIIMNLLSLIDLQVKLNHLELILIEHRM